MALSTRVKSNAVLVCALALFLQACVQQQYASRPSSTATDPQSNPENTAAYAAIRKDDGHLAAFGCKENFISRPGKGLVALRNTPGDTHYIEFRVRTSPSLPSGHMHVVYGELNGEMEPKTFNYVGLLPQGSIFGLYAGIFVPVSINGQLEPSSLDCAFKPSQAFRMSISADEYSAVLDRVEAFRKNTPQWRMLSYNCNHFAADIGKVVGLKPVQGRRSNQFLSMLYFDWYLEANGIKKNTWS